MPIRIRESHIRTTVGDVQRQPNTESGDLNNRATTLSNETINQIAERVMIQVERKLKKMQER